MTTLAAGAGGISYLLLKDRRLALLGGAGLVTGLATAILWPKPAAAAEATPEPEIEPLTAAELQTLIDSLEGDINNELAARLTTLRFSDISGLRDWEGQRDRFIELLMHCPNLETLELTEEIYLLLGFTQLPSEQQMKAALAPLAQGLTRAPLRRILAKKNQLLPFNAAEIEDLFEATPKLLRRYRDKLAIFCTTWVEEKTASAVLAALRERGAVGLQCLEALQLNDATEELIEYVYGTFPPENLFIEDEGLLDTVKGHVSWKIQEPDGLPPYLVNYLSTIKEFHWHDWAQHIPPEHLPKLLEHFSHLETFEFNDAAPHVLEVAFTRLDPAKIEYRNYSTTHEWHDHILTQVSAGQLSDGVRAYIGSLERLPHLGELTPAQWMTLAGACSRIEQLEGAGESWHCALLSQLTSEQLPPLAIDYLASLRDLGQLDRFGWYLAPDEEKQLSNLTEAEWAALLRLCPNLGQFELRQYSRAGEAWGQVVLRSLVGDELPPPIQRYLAGLSNLQDIPESYEDGAKSLDDLAEQEWTTLITAATGVEVLNLSRMSNEAWTDAMATLVAAQNKPVIFPRESWDQDSWGQPKWDLMRTEAVRSGVWSYVGYCSEDVSSGLVRFVADLPADVTCRLERAPHKVEEWHKNLANHHVQLASLLGASQVLAELLEEAAPPSLRFTARHCPLDPEPLLDVLEPLYDLETIGEWDEVPTWQTVRANPELLLLERRDEDYPYSPLSTQLLLFRKAG